MRKIMKFLRPKLRNFKSVFKNALKRYFKYQVRHGRVVSAWWVSRGRMVVVIQPQSCQKLRLWTPGCSVLRFSHQIFTEKII